MLSTHAIGGTAATIGMVLATAAFGQTTDNAFGPAPTERQFYQAADRSVHRIFGSRAAGTDWREPRRGLLVGNAGYSMCGHVRLTDHTLPVAVMVTWHRGDVEAVQLSWDGQNRPFASTWDLPWWVSPSPYVEFLCAVWTGDPPPVSASRLDGPGEGEKFDWGIPTPLPAAWRVVLHDRKWAEVDDFGQLEDCVRIRTRPGRRYRITVEAAGDTRLSILKSRDCSGEEHLIAWNDDLSVSSRNSQVEIDGSGNVYAFVKTGSGSDRQQYTLIVEEAVDNRPRP